MVRSALEAKDSGALRTHNPAGQKGNLRCPWYSGRDARSQVYFEGTVLIEDTRNPEFEACRGVSCAAAFTGHLRGVAGGENPRRMITPDAAAALQL